MSRFREADLSQLKRLPVADRPTRVSVSEFARPLEPAAAATLLASLPDLLAARTLREVVARTVAAHRRGRPVVLLLGGHVVKVGVAPCFIEWSALRNSSGSATFSHTASAPLPSVIRMTSLARSCVR